MAETLLVLNAGSSSIKFELFAVGPDDRLTSRFEGQIEGIGVAPHLIAKSHTGERLVDRPVPLRRPPTSRAPWRWSRPGSPKPFPHRPSPSAIASCTAARSMRRPW